MDQIENLNKIRSLLCSWTLRVPLMVPSGKICRNIMARTDHKERGRAQPGGRIGKIGCLHSAWSTWGVFGMDFFGWDLVVVTSLTFFLAMCWFADCSEAFDRIKMTRMTVCRTTFDRDMFPERKYCCKWNAFMKSTPVLCRIQRRPNISGMQHSH